MVCPLGSGRMAALTRLHAAGSLSQNVKEEVCQRKLAAQYIERELCEADEANLIDEEASDSSTYFCWYIPVDMIIFGLRPMTDPLDLVCCNACKKPIKASQYTIHAELCKSLISRAEVVPELDSSAVNKKPPRKERKKSVIAHNHQATSQRERKKFFSVNSENIAGTVSYLDEQIQITQLAEAKGSVQVGGSHCINGSNVGPYNMNYPEIVALHSSKPLTGEAAEASSNPGTKKFCMTTAGELPYVPAPLATKVYYSQRSHYLRRAIRLMYYEGSNKECGGEYPSIGVLPVNAFQTQTSFLSNSYLEPAVNQQRENHIFHLAQEPDQIASTSPEMHLGKSEGFVLLMNISSQLPVNNTLGPHYIPKSYSFAGKSGTVQ
ncbi:uncharacterized protein LOC142517839 isoform X2 [Primulina tabacum]|uniref:uncharacterized protein LOC142517839 isoform X2 n=1 Tax=Primulina tabacum TaxID=48773 RepID=UPI003F5A769F